MRQVGGILRPNPGRKYPSNCCLPRKSACMLLAAAFTLLVFAYSLVSRKLDGTPITAPILFTAAGALMLLFPDTSRALFIDRKALLLIAEVGLVMTLFTDASHISRKSLQDNHRLPVRLLSVGMLLTILLGAVAAGVFYGFVALAVGAGSVASTGVPVYGVLAVWQMFMSYHIAGDR